MWPIFKTIMLIYQSKAYLDEKIVCGKITHFDDPTNEKVPLRGLYGNREFRRSILVHDLCGFEVYMETFRNRILNSMASKLWTRMECEVIFPKQVPDQHNF